MFLGEDVCMLWVDVYSGVFGVEFVSDEVFVEVVFTLKESKDLIFLVNEFHTIREGGSMIRPVSDLFSSIGYDVLPLSFRCRGLRVLRH